MRRRHGKILSGGILIAVILGIGLAGGTVAQEEVTIAEKLSEALQLYYPPEMAFEKGIAMAEELLKRDDLLPQDSIAIYEVLSILTYAKGEKFRRLSFNYLDKISSVGPCIIQLPHDIWPAELRDKWYELLKAKESLACPQDAKSDIKTLAIMEFDNFSIGKYQKELGPIGKGLADLFEHDFRKISTLRVVERDKINYVLKEHELQQSGAVDRATAVRAGKILGAKYMVFGSITQVDDRHTRMVVKVVSVETSEIITSVDREGKPVYFKLEKELVVELAKKLDVQFDDDVSALIKQGGTESLDATTFYSKGLEYQDRYDYKKAYEFFKKAYDLDNSFVEAKRKMEIYEPLAS